MNNQNVCCPCCSSPLLRHARSTGMYWYCSSCHQEMPNLSDSLYQKIGLLDASLVAIQSFVPKSSILQTV
ncbi:hypothetical protein [Spirulina sp. 06S082]|uniref:hypothetical protein n=1 Tax=Spirulina sp. 06S082 TaxID=3110248 RepID=UPI002B21D9B2|nr:hypothetical protein [Spirulina sp. 06S082]MEA5468239.1 hypothetical protein [Spirulina sp. 06S082]